MRIFINILRWLVSLIAASFVAAFFVSIGIHPILYTDGYSLDTAMLKSDLYIFGGFWAFATYYILFSMLVPAILVSIITWYKYSRASPVLYGIAGAMFGAAFFLDSWYMFEPFDILSPENWQWDLPPIRVPFILGIFVGGYLGGREFAKLRNGRMRWR